jgi:predicted phage tail protein
MSWDRIAKVGTYKDMTGKFFEFTPELLSQIAENYKTQSEKAPLVFGHPQTDSPAVGWISALRVSGDYLEAQYNNVSEAAKSGAYRYKSISLEPATKKLRHVGLLGAVAPAISGLGEFSFSEAEGLTIVNFADNPQGDINMDEKAIAMIADLQAKMTEKEKELADLKAQIEELTKQAEGADKKVEEAEKKAAETEANFAKYKNEIAVAYRTSRIDALVAAGKITPAEKDKHLQMAQALSVAATVNFAADGKQISAEEQYLRDLEARGQSVLFSEFQRDDRGGNTPASVSDMAKGL